MDNRKLVSGKRVLQRHKKFIWKIFKVFLWWAYVKVLPKASSSGIFIINSEDISHLFEDISLLLLILNK